VCDVFGGVLGVQGGVLLGNVRAFFGVLYGIL